jgi:predicted enzyme related to lactoylglutathione lyase
MHLDLLVADLDAEAERLLSLGATHLSPLMQDYGTRWYVLADPEGNEFCLAEEEAG